MLKEFREFIKRGNVMDLAVAVIIAAAFGKIVTTFVEGVIMPPIGQLLGKVDFSGLFFILDEKVRNSANPPVSLTEAKVLGVPVIAYGQLINDIINFLIVAFVIFLVIRAYNRLKSKREEEVTTKDCPRCLSTIPLKATRCAECCVDLQAA
ncbi:MAG TPA: large conductance mechanosensitive channel protein MscL [Pyrinomonadaceae bacterium]|nr:large conductance mechanosensitive channel protein MscL [Pyrinomonadaceae bacterium]